MSVHFFLKSSVRMCTGYIHCTILFEKDFLFYFFRCIYFIFCVCVFCLVPTEARRGCGIPWNWSYGWLWPNPGPLLEQLGLVLVTAEPSLQDPEVFFPLFKKLVLFMCIFVVCVSAYAQVYTSLSVCALFDMQYPQRPEEGAGLWELK